ncbi:MAG: response regulator [Acidobacteria bacterium]|nr:response regulator [Acidobacteriota bacterium]
MRHEGWLRLMLHRSFHLVDFGSPSPEHPASSPLPVSHRAILLWIPGILLCGAVLTLIAFGWAVRYTETAGETLFQDEQRLLARQIADRVGETLWRAQVVTSTLDLHGLPEERQTANQWLAGQMATYRVEPWVATRVESHEGTLLASAGQPVEDHHHHGPGVVVCPRCLAEGQMLTVRGVREETGRTVEIRLSLSEFSRRLVAPITRDGRSALWLMTTDGLILASASAREIGTRPFQAMRDAPWKRLAGATGRGEEDTFAYEWNRRRLLAASAPVAGSLPALTVVISSDASDATGSVHDALTSQILALVMLVCLLTGTAGFRVWERRLHWKRERESLEARLELERVAAHSDRMASVGVLAAGVAHEINNPLAYVSANLDFVAQRGHGLRDFGDIAAAIENAREGTRRIVDTVRDLKTFSHPGDDRREPLEICDVIDSAIKMAHNEIRYRATLVKDYAEVPRVDANSSRLGQVFLNLLINAAQAIPEGHVSENEIRVSTRLAGNRVVAEVRDTGPGIPASLIGHIFEPFFTTKPKGVGTGLGLAICRGIVRSIDGDISVSSEPGKGTSFSVSLPAVERTGPVEEPAVPHPMETGPRLRILVIDDEPYIREALRLLLSDEHDVELAANSRDALLLLAIPNSFDVILCDLQMPDLSGMEIYEEVQHSRPGTERRFVFMTGGAFTDRARAFLKAVPNPRIDKPFQVAALRSLIRTHAARDPARAATISAPVPL